MFRSAFLALVMTFVLACAAQPSFAAGYNAGSFTANLPAGWTMTQDEEVTNFAEPSGPLELVILIKKYDDESIDDVVAEMAGQTPVQFLDANIYIYEDSSGSRGWCMLADDGTVADISTNMAYVNMKSFISGLNAAGDEPGLAEIFKALASSKQAADWLNYVTPAFADSEGGSDPGDTEDEGTLFEHKTFTATIPVGWTAAEQGESVVFASEANDGFVIVRVFELGNDDEGEFLSWAKEQAKMLEGQNVNADGGVVEFTTAKGANGMFTQFDTQCLFVLFGGDSPEIGNLIKSIGL